MTIENHQKVHYAVGLNKPAELFFLTRSTVFFTRKKKNEIHLLRRTPAKVVQ